MRYSWPKGIRFEEIVLVVEDRSCQTCGKHTLVKDYKDRRLWRLDAPVKLVSQMTLCEDKLCRGAHQLFVAEGETIIAPPRWVLGWDVFAHLGYRRFGKSWSVPEIQEELRDAFGIPLSADCIEDYVGRYQTIVAARQNDFERLSAEYADIPSLLLSIDGLQPEKGHETLYTVRELSAKRVWFAEALLSSSAAEVGRLLEKAKQWAQRLEKPVRAWVSDKQDAFLTGIAELFPGCPHRYCGNHFFRDAAKPVLQIDSAAKVVMRGRIRGLRGIEREVLENQHASSNSETPKADSPEKVVLDYCAATRGILNNSQGGPLEPPGLAMADALGDVRASIQSNLDAGICGTATDKLERLASIIDRGIGAVADVHEKTRGYVDELKALSKTLDPANGDCATRETQFASMRDRFKSSADDVLVGVSKVMTSWQPGLFAGGDDLDFLKDNLDLERWFRLPKSHQRKIDGHKHVGTSVVEEGPSLVLALDAHHTHRRPFTIDELRPYFGARPTVSERLAVERRKLMKRARSRKKRAELLADFERRLREHHGIPRAAPSHRACLANHA